MREFRASELGSCLTRQVHKQLGSTALDPPPTCSIADCERPVKSRGWCAMHYMRWYVHGNPETRLVGGNPVRSIAERFWEKVLITETCWLWTGATNGAGYGMIYTPERERNTLAHRWAYEFLVGPIPEGLSLDHLCRVTLCVREDHLEPVTHLENVRRGIRARRA